MESFTLNSWILFQLLFTFECIIAFKITELKVPILVDPRDELQLGCHYDMGHEELYSVKWYKDEQEFFRYTPRQQPHIKSFPVAGVHLVPAGGSCTISQCTVRLSGLSTAHSSGSYRCEVSTEAPAFRVAFAIGNVTVAAVGKHVPMIEGLRDLYSVNDLIQANCTTAPADPPAIVTWKLNGKPVSVVHLGPMRNLTPDSKGLVAAYQDLRFHVERRHFSGPGRTLLLECEAGSPPGVPAPPLTTSVTVHLFDPQVDVAATQQRNILSNQKLEWFHNHAPSQFAHQGIVFGLILTVFRWR